GNYASLARRTKRAGDCEPGTNARNGRQARRRAAADSRPLERTRHWHGRRNAAIETGDFRSTAVSLRYEAANEDRFAHDGFNGSRWKWKAEIRTLLGRKPVRLESGFSLCCGGSRKTRLAGLHEHNAQHRTRPWTGRGDDYSAGARSR